MKIELARYLDYFLKMDTSENCIIEIPRKQEPGVQATESDDSDYQDRYVRRMTKAVPPNNIQNIQNFSYN